MAQHSKNSRITPSDAELELLFTLRDERALTAIEDKYGKAARSFAYRILGDRQDAEECLNDVLMQLWETIPPMPENLPAYINTLVRNCCFNRLKAQNREKRGGSAVREALDDLAPYLSAPDNTEDVIDRLALTAALDQFLTSISKEARLIFLARYWKLYSVKEIAAQHDWSEGKVKMSLKRTRERLKEHLKKEGLL